MIGLLDSHSTCFGFGQCSECWELKLVGSVPGTPQMNCALGGQLAVFAGQSRPVHSVLWLAPLPGEISVDWVLACKEQGDQANYTNFSLFSRNFRGEGRCGVVWPGLTWHTVWWPHMVQGASSCLYLLAQWRGSLPACLPATHLLTVKVMAVHLNTCSTPATLRQRKPGAL